MPTRQSGTLRPSDREGRGPLTPQQIQRQLASVYGRGIQLHRAGMVALERHDEGGASGHVRDDLPEAYAVHVAVRGPAGAPILESACSCELRGDCEHAVALALAWQAEAARVGASAPRPTSRAGCTAEAPPKPQLPCPWAEWLREVENRTAAEAEAPAREEDHILYLLALDDGRALVRPIRARALRTGRLGGTKPIELDDDEALERLSRLSPADRAGLLALKFGRRAYRGHEPWIDVDSAGPGVLECLLETNRCHLDDPNGPVVGLGPMRPLTICWRLHDDGSQTIEPDVGGGTAFGDQWSWYHDPDRRRIGRLEPGSLAGRIALLREAPPVQPDYRAAAAAALAKAGFAELPPRWRSRWSRAGSIPAPC